MKVLTVLFATLLSTVTLGNEPVNPAEIASLPQAGGGTPEGGDPELKPIGAPKSQLVPSEYVPEKDLYNSDYSSSSESSSESFSEE